MNNAGIGLKGTSFGELENWKRVMDVNLWGCVSFSLGKVAMLTG